MLYFRIQLMLSRHVNSSSSWCVYLGNQIARPLGELHVVWVCWLCVVYCFGLIVPWFGLFLPLFVWGCWCLRRKLRFWILLFCLWCEDLGRFPGYVLVFQLVRYTFCILAVGICSWNSLWCLAFWFWLWKLWMFPFCWVCSCGVCVSLRVGVFK